MTVSRRATVLMIMWHMPSIHLQVREDNDDMLNSGSTRARARMAATERRVRTISNCTAANVPLAISITSVAERINVRHYRHQSSSAALSWPTLSQFPFVSSLSRPCHRHRRRHRHRITIILILLLLILIPISILILILTRQAG